ncbi:MAG: Localization factor PodJS, partial [Caulobacteraceae bacterium]
MSVGAPWSVKGIDPKAREIAKDLARRSGMTLGDWLNQMILEDGDSASSVAAFQAEADPDAADADDEQQPNVVAEALERLTSRIESAEHRSTLAISGIDQSVNGLLARVDRGEREQTAVAARIEGELQDIREQQSKTLERLARTEEQAAQPKSLEAMRSLEAALGKVASHLYDSDANAREGLEAVRDDMGALQARLDRIDATAVMPEQAIEAAVSRIMGRLEQAEMRTSTALQSLETSFAEFDTRLRTAEMRNDAPEERLERLADELARNFSDARAELAERLRDTAGGRVEAIEKSLQQMSEHVGDAERRSAMAIEKMGHEVLRMADHLGRRMEGVEVRSAHAIEKVGTDVSRIADNVEARFRRADALQAESLEKLGGEIARITERLAERIANAERRSAQAIDDVGEQVTRVTERLTERQERASTDIAERIRQSEERTARLLEEAREKIGQRLTKLAEAEPAPAPRKAASQFYDDEDLYIDQDLAPGPFGQAAGQQMPHAPQARTLADRAFDLDPATSDASMQAPALESDFGAFTVNAGDDDFSVFDKAADDTADEAFPAFGGFEAETPARNENLFDQEQPASASSTRDLIEQARAAARQAGAGETDKPKSGGLFGGFGTKKKAKDKSPVKTALMVSAAAAALGVAAFGYTILSAQWVGSGAKRGSEIAAAAPTSEITRGEPLAAVA